MKTLVLDAMGVLYAVGDDVGEIVFVDDKTANLDAAAALGIQTILFLGRGHRPNGKSRHPTVHDCDELLAKLIAAANEPS